MITVTISEHTGLGYYGMGKRVDHGVGKGWTDDDLEKLVRGEWYSTPLLYI